MQTDTSVRWAKKILIRRLQQKEVRRGAEVGKWGSKKLTSEHAEDYTTQLPCQPAQRFGEDNRSCAFPIL